MWSSIWQTLGTAVLIATILPTGAGGAPASAPTSRDLAPTTREAALGAAGFCPSADRPVGFLGDGSGRYPGATPPTRWDENTGENIVWKTAMPTWGCASPIVVGNKVFVCGEPHTLICIDANTGGILWKKSNDPLELFPKDEADKARALWNAELNKQIESWMILWQMRSGFNILRGPRSRKDIEEAPYAFTQHEPHCYRKATTQYAESLKIRRELTQQYGMCFEYWPGSIGHAFATPVSDGQSVYVTYGWGQVVCYDLDGTRKWMKWFKPNMEVEKDASQGGYPNTYFCNSPRLAGNHLITQTGCYLRALKKDTGELVWETRYKPQRFTVGLSQVMRVGGMELLVTGHEKVYDLATGKVVAEGLVQGYGSPVVNGDVAYMMEYSSHRAEPGKACGAYRFSLDAGGAVKMETLWMGPAASWMGPVYDDGLLYVDGSVYDAANGSLIAQVGPSSSYGPHSVIAGDWYFMPDKTGRMRVARKGRDGKVVFNGRFEHDDPKKVLDLKAPVEQIKQRWWDRGYYGLDALMVATPFFQGGRMYVRTHEYLYCIGER